ncbi:hypothetical protein NW768_002693 [Fusarium equiseti]|uniref:Uncharacterized protein n=1 Tax=Fusarium equiseti TaxID=61235 RepID=A0ABQ8RJZ2_FUSEQ|nr:hypothetical protein NW768_002693 [Fusarium equiseti]
MGQDCVRESPRQDEKKIDQIDKRLDGIERLLQELTRSNIDHNGNPVESHTQSIKDNRSKLSSGSPFDEPQIDESPGLEFEGGSSLSAHTVAASEIFWQEVQESSLQDRNPAINTVLSSLHEIVSQVGKHSSSGGVTLGNAKALPHGGLSELPMPPMPAVLAALHGPKGGCFSIYAVALFRGVR